MRVELFNNVVSEKVAEARQMLSTISEAVELEGESLELVLTDDETSDRIAFEVGYYDDFFRPTLKHVPYINLKFGIRHVAQKIAALVETLLSTTDKYEKKITEVHHKTVDEAISALDNCVSNGIVSFDLETTGLDFYDSAVPTLAVFSDRPGVVNYIVLDREDGVGTKETKRFLTYFVLNVLKNKSVIKVGQNLKFDLLIIKAATGLDVRPFGTLYDTMILSHLLDENSRNHNLESLTLRYEPGYAGFKKAMKGIDWKTVSLEDLVPYACKDCHVTLLIASELVQRLLADKRLVDYYHNMSMPLMYLLVDMAWNGVDVDEQLVADSIEKYENVIAEMQQELLNHPSMVWYLTLKNNTMRAELEEELRTKMAKHKEGGVHHTRYSKQLEELSNYHFQVNLNSDDHVKEFLSAIGIKVAKTDKHTLAEHKHPWIELWQAYKQVAKMVGTYYKGIQKHSHRGKLYGSFLQTGTVTHRLASNEPNLQNLPVRSRIADERAKKALKQVKSFFKVPDGYVFIACDMSQAELRTIANVSGDTTMQNVYLSGQDIHSLTASRILGVSYEKFLEMKKTDPDVFNSSRFGAKGANFGMVYKISPKSYVLYLKQQYGVEITEEDERVHRKAIFGTYDKLSKWHNTYIGKGKKFKQVRSLFGTCRRLPDIDSDEGWKSSAAEREAINAPIQATSAQYCLFSMIVLQELLSGLDVAITLQIHDAVYLRALQELQDFCSEALQVAFSEAPIQLFGITKDRMPVPMAIDIEVGTAWDNVQPI